MERVSSVSHYVPSRSSLPFIRQLYLRYCFKRICRASDAVGTMMLNEYLTVEVLMSEIMQQVMHLR